MRLAENPIFVREGWPGKWAHRSPALRVGAVVLYLGGAALLAWGAYKAAHWSVGLFSILLRSPGTGPQGGAMPGLTAQSVSVAGALMILGTITNLKWFVARALAAILPALAIAPERERFTWDQVMLTNLSARDILLGKGLSRLLPCLWVVLFCLPAEILLLTLLRGQEIPLAMRQQSGWIATVPLPVAWGIESALQVLAVLAYATIALLWSLKSRKSLNAFFSAVTTIILVGIVSTIVSWALLLAFGFFRELMAFMSQAMSSPSTGGPFVFSSESVRRMTLILSVYRFVVPLAIVFVLWRVMLGRFHMLDARVRGAIFTPRPSRRNIVVPEAYAP